jgi:hypothetical protein
MRLATSATSAIWAAAICLYRGGGYQRAEKQDCSSKNDQHSLHDSLLEFNGKTLRAGMRLAYSTAATGAIWAAIRLYSGGGYQSAENQDCGSKNEYTRLHDSLL